MMAEPHVHGRVTEMTYSAVPETHDAHDWYAVKVVWRGGDQYVVTRMSRYLDADGQWSYGPEDDEDREAWFAAHRFDYDTACRLAAQACRHTVVNGRTVADALADLGEARRA